MNKIEISELHNLVQDIDYMRMPNSNMTVACVTLKSGFKLIGYSSTISNEFDAELGKQYSYEHAIEQLWELEAYHRTSRLYEDSLVAQCNVEAWDSRELGADEEFTDLAPASDDIVLHAMINEDKKSFHENVEQVIFEDASKWEPSEDEHGNYVPPELGADERFVKKSKMPDALLKLLGRG